jgi:hypothetical protein
VKLHLANLPSWWAHIPGGERYANLLLCYHDSEGDSEPWRETFVPHAPLCDLVLDAIEQLRCAEMDFTAEELDGVQITPPEPPLDDIERRVVRARLSSARSTDATLDALCNAFAVLPAGIPKRKPPLRIEERRALLRAPMGILPSSPQQEAEAQLVITLVDRLEERYGFTREETHFALELLRQQVAGS